MAARTIARSPDQWRSSPVFAVENSLTRYFRFGEFSQIAGYGISTAQPVGSFTTAERDRETGQSGHRDRDHSVTTRPGVLRQEAPGDSGGTRQPYPPRRDANVRTSLYTLGIKFDIAPRTNRTRSRPTSPRRRTERGEVGSGRTETGQDLRPGVQRQVKRQIVELKNQPGGMSRPFVY